MGKFRNHLDDGEDGLDFIFQHFKAASQFAFDFVEAVFVAGVVVMSRRR